MRLSRTALLCSAALLIGPLIVPSRAQTPDVDWPSHNLDRKNGRFSQLIQIDASNVGTLTSAWSFQVPPSEGIAQQTPVVVDGVMYFNSGLKLFALDAVTGKPLWTAQAQPPSWLSGSNVIGGIGGRGPTFGDGRIYATAGAVVYAVNAKTGTLVASFGEGGVLPLINKALAFKYPRKYSDDLDPRTIGYRFSAPPAYDNNTLFVGMAASGNLIPGGLLAAVDATTGAVKWVFNTVPQAPGDDGWQIAGPTWGYGRRFGGGIWTQPAVDVDLGLIFFNASNPSPDYDGTARVGTNLFTDSMMALHLATGRLAWYFQTVHHDVWDFDLANGPVLFDVTTGPGRIKGIASFGKSCYAYILNREAGQPVNPIVETSVPTKTDVPGEKPWPTQPIPHTATGATQQPFCAVYPTIADPKMAERARPQFHPFLMNDRIVASPGVTGGATWGSSSFSPRTGLLYVSGKNQAASLKVKPVGDTATPGPNAPGFRDSHVEADDSIVKVTQTLAAYDAVTGVQVWRTDLPGGTNTGNVVTAGDVVFQGVGPDFFAFDARTGRQLFKAATRGISGSPLTYQVAGKQYVTVIAGSIVQTFSLP